MAGSPPSIRLGSRSSILARWQAEEVQRRLAAAGVAAEVVWIRTSGDRMQSGPLAAIGGKGLFTKELEEALLARRVDAAVHSLKDVPTDVPPGLALGAVLEREDPRDALVAAPGTTLASLPASARLGTASLRRQAQLLALRPDLKCIPLRGNVDTRLQRWRAGEFDAIVLACAGLRRLGLEAVIAERLDPGHCCPAAGQGALAIECRAGDAAVLGAIARLNHAPTSLAVAAERAVLRRLQCGCDTPVGAYASWHAGQLRLAAVVAVPDGTQVLRSRMQRNLAPQDLGAAEALGTETGDDLLAQGAREILLACESAP